MQLAHGDSGTLLSIVVFGQLVLTIMIGYNYIVDPYHMQLAPGDSGTLLSIIVFGQLVLTIMIVIIIMANYHMQLAPGDSEPSTR